VRPPSHKQQAVDGKSDLIDTETAARSVLGREETRVATPRATGDHSDLRILLATRRLLDTQRTACRNALTALLRIANLGVDARRAVSDAQVTAIAAWRLTGGSPATKIARTEARRMARAIADYDKQLRENSSALSKLVDQVVTGLQTLQASDPSPPRSSAAPTPTTAGSDRRPPSPPSPASPRSRPPRATPSGTGSTAAATANSTAPSTSSSRPGSASTPRPVPTPNAVAHKANHPVRSAASSSATSAAPSSANSTPSWRPLDRTHRRVILGEARGRRTLPPAAESRSPVPATCCVYAVHAARPTRHG
jgi:hypothetical protein